jgi:hypothetical protein
MGMRVDIRVVISEGLCNILVIMLVVGMVVILVRVVREVYKMGLGEGGSEGEELNVTGGAESGDGGREKIWEKIMRIIRDEGPRIVVIMALWKEVGCDFESFREYYLPFWVLILLLILLS